MILKRTNNERISQTFPPLPSGGFRLAHSLRAATCLEMLAALVVVLSCVVALGQADPCGNQTFYTYDQALACFHKVAVWREVQTTLWLTRSLCADPVRRADRVTHLDSARESLSTGTRRHVGARLFV
jgi:hypothetical protein